MKEYIINNEWISLTQLEEIIDSKATVSLGENARKAIAECRAYLDEKVNAHDGLIYGVNKGFGSLCNTAISRGDLEKLQRNLVESHACGTGEEVPHNLVKRMLLLKVIGRHCRLFLNVYQVILQNHIGLFHHFPNSTLISSLH